MSEWTDIKKKMPVGTGVYEVTDGKTEARVRYCHQRNSFATTLTVTSWREISKPTAATKKPAKK